MAYINHVISTQNERRTSPYGERIDPLTGRKARHDGIDIVDANGLQLKNDGVAIIAIADGKVAATGNHVSAGYYIDIAHDGKILSRYFHMRAGSIAVKSGDTVKKGQKIGIMGKTGDGTGIHLHFAIRENSTSFNTGAYADPEPYLTGLKKISSIILTPQITAIKAGDKIKILTTAKTYAGNSTIIPEKYKNVLYTVQQINGDKALIKELYSWVYIKDIQKV